MALRDPVTREVLRGAVFVYKDLHERAIPVEVVLPGEFLERASTNPADIAGLNHVALAAGCETWAAPWHAGSGGTKKWWS